MERQTEVLKASGSPRTYPDLLRLKKNKYKIQKLKTAWMLEASKKNTKITEFLTLHQQDCLRQRHVVVVTTAEDTVA